MVQLFILYNDYHDATTEEKWANVNVTKQKLQINYSCSVCLCVRMKERNDIWKMIWISGVNEHGIIIIEFGSGKKPPFYT